jgi:hypothetical protein
VVPEAPAEERLREQYRDVFSRIEKEFGVPGPVVLAIWGRESDYSTHYGGRGRPPAAAPAVQVEQKCEGDPRSVWKPMKGEAERDPRAKAAAVRSGESSMCAPQATGG